MTALGLHTVLTVVLVAWAYLITSRVPYRPAWIWSGTALLVLVGYFSLIARSVFDGSPARVQVIVANLGALLVAVAGIICFALFAGVSRVPRGAVAAARTDASAWAPHNEEPVIVPDDEAWDAGSVIDAGTAPSGAPVDEEPQGGRYSYASADDAEASPSSAPTHAAASPLTPVVTQPASGPATAAPVAGLAAPSSVAPPPATVAYQPFAPPATAAAPPATVAHHSVAGPLTTSAEAAGSPATAPWAPAAYQPAAPPPGRAAASPTTSSADEEPEEHIAPRRALLSPTDMGE